MNLVRLVWKELWYRKINSLVILLTVIVASAVSTAVFTLSKASENETRKIMREQGLNLYIFPRGTNLIDFYSVNDTPLFPESYVDSLAASKSFDAVRHLTGILQFRVPEWTDPNGSRHQIVAVGYKDEAIQRFLPKQETMGFDVPRGTVQVGSLLARNIPEGEPFVIKGKNGATRRFPISKRLTEGKGIIDQGVAFHLTDLQELMGMVGQINKIEALGCICHDGRIKNARAQVQAIFPDLEVTEISSIADARENQRLMMNRYGAILIPLVGLSALLIAALLFYSNVLGRREEIGLMKALGKSHAFVSGLFLLKAFFLGLTGSAIGFFAGTLISEQAGSKVFRFTAGSIGPEWSLLGYTLLIFPLLWMIASWIPALLATQIDAAKILSQE
ncbi:MAG: FtsX-like permease family protein [Prolixibacteraceae bacterium]|nr:FtsX-like permease family protein [Prolixibacteraceae bacterium]